jgi:hypothetical protein
VPRPEHAPGSEPARHAWVESRHAQRRDARIPLGVILAVWLSAPALAPAADEAAKAPEAAAETTAADYRNWFDVSVGGAWIDGNGAAYQRRTGLPNGAYGGVEDFHWEQDVGKRGLFQIDGRGIFDNHDYGLKLELDYPDIGFVRFGYREFRTWYDGSGGYFPANGQWFEIYDDELALDRGEVWFEAGLRKPDVPEITLRYAHTFRDGMKNSTIWGDSNLTGGYGTRGIVPTFLGIDEERHSFGLDIAQGFYKTDVGVGLRYELSDQDNARYIRRRPNEPQDRYLTQRDGIETDMFNAHAFSETRFNDAVMLTVGYSFTTLDTDLSGSRIYGAGYDAVYDPTFGRRQQRDEGFLALAGGSQLHQHVVNLNLMWTPFDAFTVVPAFRFEKQDLDSLSDFLETNVGAPPGLPSTQEELASESARDLIDVSEAIEARYTGVTNWVFYVRGNWTQGEGDQFERETLLATGASDILRDSDFERFTQKYTAGANWYPARSVNLSAQYYHKIRNDDFEHTQDDTPNRSGNRYPAFLVANDFTTDDVNFRLTWRPVSQLTLVTRYDYQQSTIDMQGDGLDSIESADLTTHIISQSVSWVPWARFYLQTSASIAFDSADTPASSAVPGTNLVLNAENDYWNITTTAGFVLGKKTDLQAQHFYYRADNWEDNSASSQPYGAGVEEHGIGGTLLHRLNERVQLALRYSFFHHKDETSGGYNDFDAHMIYSSLRYAF